MLTDEKLNSLTKKSEINKIGCARSTWFDITLKVLMKEQLLWRIARGCSTELAGAHAHTHTRTHRFLTQYFDHTCRFLIQSFAFLTSLHQKGRCCKIYIDSNTFLNTVFLSVLRCLDHRSGDKAAALSACFLGVSGDGITLIQQDHIPASSL